MKAIKLFLIAGVSLLALGSCQKDEKVGGQAIRFSASAIGTKTAYDETSPGQINWIEGEQVRVWSDEATQRYDASKKFYDYVVSEPSGKEAKLANQENGNGLVYVDGVDSYNFWAVSPASAVSSPAAGKAGYTIKAAQTGESIADGVIPADMTQAVLLASATGPWKPYANTDKTVKLAFQPAFTAFEVTMEGASIPEGEKIDIVSVALVSGEGLAGDVVATFGADGISYEATPAALTFAFPEGTSLTNGSTVTFTVFALPLAGTGLQLQFTLGDGQVRTATLMKGEEPFPIVACQKHRLYGLAMPSDFKMFALDDNVDVADTQQEEDLENINL